MANKGRDRANQLVAAETSVDFTKQKLLLSAHEHEQRDRSNEIIVIVTHKRWSAVNCTTKVGIVPFSWLLLSCLSIHKARTAVISTRTETE